MYASKNFKYLKLLRERKLFGRNTGILLLHLQLGLKNVIFNIVHFKPLTAFICTDSIILVIIHKRRLL